MHPVRESIKQAGYEYIESLGNGEHLLRETETGALEIWFSNKGTAAYAIAWNKTDLEFARGV